MARNLLSKLKPLCKLSPCHDIVRRTQLRCCSSLKTQFLSRGEDKAIAYRMLDGDTPGVIFCPGFQSTMEGVKASALEQYCRAKKLSYVRFDYQGVGQSPGDLKEMTLTDWRADVLAVLDQITAGPQILVGSSMGGILMLYTALARPHRIHALVGIATASRFAGKSIEAFPPQAQKDVKERGVAMFEHDGYPYIITQKFLDDLPNHDILAQEDDIKIKCPVHLLHGMQDANVPFSHSIDLAKKLWTNDVQLIFDKVGDHRFSQPEDIQLLFETLDLLIFGVKDIRELAISSRSSFTLFPQPDHLVTKKKVLKKY